MRAGLRLDMQHSSRSCRRNSAPPPPKPRGGLSALAGQEERADQARCPLSPHHTRSLCAQSPAQNEQRCCWFGRRRSIFWIGSNSCLLSDAARWPTSAQGKIPAARGPSCICPMPQLKREWSLAASFGPADASYHEISNTYLAHGFLSLSPTCPAMQSVSVGYVSRDRIWGLSETEHRLSIQTVPNRRS